MSRQQISSHYARLLTRWPVDRIRPEERHFQKLLRSRVQAAPAERRDERGEVNAAYLLLDNTFSKQFTLSETTMRPASNPTHYVDLERELDEAPDRTWFANLKKRMANMIRFK